MNRFFFLWFFCFVNLLMSQLRRRFFFTWKCNNLCINMTTVIALLYILPLRLCPVVICEAIILLYWLLGDNSCNSIRKGGGGNHCIQKPAHSTVSIHTELQMQPLTMNLSSTLQIQVIINGQTFSRKSTASAWLSLEERV